MAANASLHSMASKSSMLMPDRARSLRVAGFGADSTSTASSPATTMWRITARTGRPSVSAVDRSAMSIAEEPSDICDELPAVMSGAIEGSHEAADASAPSDSIVPPRRMPSSASSTPPVSRPSASLIGTGTSSVFTAPESTAAAARRCDSRAYSSMSSRPILNRSAKICATSNCVISFPSQAARKSGEKGPMPPDAFDAIGARVIDSVPQAMARS